MRYDCHTDQIFEIETYVLGIFRQTKRPLDYPLEVLVDLREKEILITLVLNLIIKF